MKYFVALLLLVSPSAANGAVMINEIAWMGTSASPNHEWIELYNDGSEVDLTGWRVSDGNTLNILLSGRIGEQEFAVLERTSEETAPGEAWLIYVGALVNTGTTLTLYNNDGLRIDQVSGGENWERIGGNNESKDTAQRTASGWVTAPGTPGTVNAARSVPQPEAEETTESSTTKKDVGKKNGNSVSNSSSEPKLVLELPDRDLSLDVIAAETGYVNQPVKFTIDASGLGKTWLDSLKFDWNFGDGNTASGTSVSHRFSYPGSYVVSVYGTFNRYDATAKKEITILPTTLSVNRTTEGRLLLHNDALYETDISGYVVRAGEATFTFPPRSYISARQSVPIPFKEVSALATVFDNVGVARVTEVAPAPSLPAVVPVIAISETSTQIVDAAVTIEPVLSSAEQIIQPEVFDEPEPTGYFGFSTGVVTTPPAVGIEDVTPPTLAATITTTTAVPVNRLSVAPETTLATSGLTDTQAAKISQATEASTTRLRDWWLAALIVLLVISVIAVYTKPTKR